MNENFKNVIQATIHCELTNKIWEKENQNLIELQKTLRLSKKTNNIDSNDAMSRHIIDAITHNHKMQPHNYDTPNLNRALKWHEHFKRYAKETDQEQTKEVLWQFLWPKHFNAIL